MNTKCSPLIRSFFGGGLGAALAIFPASYFNSFWLCLLGAIIGWLVGYHGDRIIYGFVLGWKEACFFCRATRSMFTTLIGVTLGWIPSTGTCLEGFINRVQRIRISICRFFRAIRVFANAFGAFFARLFKGIIFLPARSWKKYHSHPMNQICLVRYILLAICACIMLTMIYSVVSIYAPQVGDVNKIALDYSYTNFRYDIYTMDMVMRDRMLYSGVAALFIILPMLMFYSAEEKNVNTFYRIRESYSQSRSRFIFNELCYLFYLQVWNLLMVAYFSAAIVIGFIGLVCIGLVSLMIIMVGLRFSWHLVRINKDYGLVSLVVALAVGVSTFLVLRERLVSDMNYLLIVSVASFFASGLLSVGLTYLGNFLFCRVKWFKHFAGEVKDDWFMDDSFEIVSRFGMFMLKKTFPVVERSTPKRRRLYVL